MAQTEREEIVRLMVGRNLAAEGRRTPVAVGEERLSVDGLTSVGTFDEVSFSVRSGEIVGMAG
jgi:ABC-type sugar transport system ATPase subunit